MGMSKQMTFTLACAVVLSALGPGVAGYLSARLESIEAAERNLRALETRLQIREAREARPAALPGACESTPAPPRLQDVPATALAEQEEAERRLPDLPARPGMIRY
jgi:hypothetical protein